MKATWYMTGALFLAAISMPFVLLFLYANVENVRSGTPDYWFGVSEVVKGVPIVSACNQPLYTSLSKTGGDPAMSSVVFETDVSVEHARDVMVGHFEARGCVGGVDTSFGPGMICADGHEVTIEVIAGEPCNAVAVKVYELGSR